DGPRRQDNAIGCRLERVSNLFYRYDGTTGREHSFFLNSGYTPKKYVSVTVCLLGVNDRYIRVDRSYRYYFLSCERTFHRSNGPGVSPQIVAVVSDHYSERQAGCAGGNSGGQAGMAVFFDFERMRPSVFDSIPKARRQANSRVSGP